MIVATSIEFIKNLIQLEYDNRYYDLHNDYNCEKVSYSTGELLIKLKSLTDGDLLFLKFMDVEITSMDFFNVKEIAGLTLDSIYRGRVEFNGELKEVSEDGKGYFYLEFYEGQKLEFWAKGLGIGK